MTVVFVTGTDTGVGKTIATATLVVVAREAGLSPYVAKPAQTGVTEGEVGDLDTVRVLVGDVPGHEGVRLPDPLAPDTAARLAGVTLPDICNQRDRILEPSGEHLVLVEGAGGVLVNLGDHWTQLDLAQFVAERTDVIFVVVARAGLGTLNHSALTVHAIQSRGFYVGGLVIGSWPDQPDLAMEQNLLDLPLATGVPIVGRIPAGAGDLDQDVFTRTAGSWIELGALFV